MKDKTSDVLLYRVRTRVSENISPSQLFSTGFHFYSGLNERFLLIRFLRDQNKKSTNQDLFCGKRISRLLQPEYPTYQKTERTNGKSYTPRGMFFRTQTSKFVRTLVDRRTLELLVVKNTQKHALNFAKREFHFCMMYLYFHDQIPPVTHKLDKRLRLKPLVTPETS